MQAIAETRQESTIDETATAQAVAVIIPGYLSKEATAAYLAKSEATLDRWHRLRVGPPRTKLGNSTYYREAALKAWLVAQEQASLRTGR